jgi:hypothetical protein
MYLRDLQPVLWLTHWPRCHSVGADGHASLLATVALVKTHHHMIVTKHFITRHNYCMYAVWVTVLLGKRTHRPSDIEPTYRTCSVPQESFFQCGRSFPCRQSFDSSHWLLFMSPEISNPPLSPNLLDCRHIYYGGKSDTAREEH